MYRKTASKAQTGKYDKWKKGEMLNTIHHYINLRQVHTPVRQEIAGENLTVSVTRALSYQAIFMWIFPGVSSVLFNTVLLLQFDHWNTFFFKSKPFFIISPCCSTIPCLWCYWVFHCCFSSRNVTECCQTLLEFM